MIAGLHTQVFNPGASAQALVVHGLGADASTMWRITGHLAARGLQVVAPDLRGHGQSPPGPSHAVEELAEDLGALGDGWDLVVGHSLGAAIAARLLPTAGWTARAVLLDPPLRLSATQREQLAVDEAAAVEGTLTLERVRAEQPDWPPDDQFRKVRAAAAVSRGVVHSVFADTGPWDLLADAASWQADTLVVAGDPDLGSLVSPTDEADLAELDHVEVRRLPGVGHDVHRDALDEVLALL